MAWNSSYKIGGVPLVSVGFVARGIIAIGFTGYGVITIAQFGVGVIAICQFSVGVITISQFSFAVITFGQMCIGIFVAIGQSVVGFFAFGASGQVGYYTYDLTKIESPASIILIIRDSFLADQGQFFLWFGPWILILFIVFRVIRNHVRRKY